MTVRVDIAPEMFSWACERSGRDRGYLEKKFPKLADWEDGAVQPTFKQLEEFAKATYMPFGYMFLGRPKKEPTPIADFRTISPGLPTRISVHLLDTIYAMQSRCDYLRDLLEEDGVDPVDFVGNVTLNDPPTAVAHKMRRRLGLEGQWADKIRTWEAAVRTLRELAEEAGVMAVVNGVVGNDTSRKLDVREFRGFALCDAYAPLVFVNGADSDSAKMFTLAHELAHLWLGKEGLSGFEGVTAASDRKEEQFCDAVAAEFLVPAAELTAYWPEVQRSARPFERIARRFKVSPVVAARRALDLGFVSRKKFFGFYKEYTAKEIHNKKKKPRSGGDFYATQNARVGKYFATTIIRAARGRRVSSWDAYQLTDLYGRAFKKYGQLLGI